MMETDPTGEGPANQPSDIDTLALLRADLAETSALLRNCAAIGRDDGQDIARRLPAMGAAAQLARAGVQIAKLLRDETRHADERGVVIHERVWEVPRSSSHPPMQRALDRWHAQNDAGKSAAEALTRKRTFPTEKYSEDFLTSTGIFAPDAEYPDEEDPERRARP